MTKAPITALYAALLALWFLFLSLRVVLYRQSTRIRLGTGGDEAMLKRVRIHANAAEYLPLALILMLLLELNTALIWPLHAAGIALLVGRVLHCWGISQSTGVSMGRASGVALTWLVIAALALADLAYALALVF